MTDPALALASLVVEEEESDVAKLKQAWMNEQHAPELLPYQTQLVDDVKAQLDAASETIEKLETKVENMLRIKLLQLDVTRYDTQPVDTIDIDSAQSAVLLEPLPAITTG